MQTTIALAVMGAIIGVIALRLWVLSKLVESQQKLIHTMADKIIEMKERCK